MKENFNLFLNLRAGFNLHKAGKGIYLKPLPWSVLFFASRTKTAMFLSSTTIVMMKLICVGKVRRVGSDGNCLFRSVSVALTGTEEASNDLRLLSSIELYENAEHYASHHHFDNVLNSLALYSTSSNNLFIQALSDVGCEIYTNTK